MPFYLQMWVLISAIMEVRCHSKPLVLHFYYFILQCRFLYYLNYSGNVLHDILVKLVKCNIQIQILISRSSCRLISRSSKSNNLLSWFEIQVNFYNTIVAPKTICLELKFSPQLKYRTSNLNLGLESSPQFSLKPIEEFQRLFLQSQGYRSRISQYNVKNC